MKILIAVEEHYPIGGGIQQYLRGLGKELLKRGHEVVFLTRTIEGETEQEIMEEGLVIRTPLMLKALPNPEIVLNKWDKFTPVIKEINPDIVYANNHNSVAVIKACKKLNISVVYCCHGWGLQCPLKIRFLKSFGLIISSKIKSWLKLQILI